MRWEGTRVMDGRDEKCIKILVGKPGRKRPLGRSMSRWEHNIRVGPKKMGIEFVD
jgi:hypothetical protein